MDLDHFFHAIPPQLCRHQVMDNINLAERLSVRSEEITDILGVIRSRLLEDRGCGSTDTRQLVTDVLGDINVSTSPGIVHQSL